MRCKDCGYRVIYWYVDGIVYETFDKYGDIIDTDYSEMGKQNPVCAYCGSEDLEDERE